MQLDDFGKLAFDRHILNLESYNSQVKASKSVNTIEEFQEFFLENDPSLKAFNEELEELMSKVESIKIKRLANATPHIQSAYQEAIKEAGVDPVALDELLKVIKASEKYLISIYGDEVLKGTPSIERRKSSTSTDPNAPKQRRIHGWSLWVDGVLATVDTKKGPRSNFTAAAKAAKTDVGELQQKFLDAAGMDDYKNDDFPTLVEFTINEHNVKAIKQGDSDEEETSNESAE